MFQIGLETLPKVALWFQISWNALVASQISLNPLKTIGCKYCPMGILVKFLKCLATKKSGFPCSHFPDVEKHMSSRVCSLAPRRLLRPISGVSEQELSFVVPLEILASFCLQRLLSLCLNGPVSHLLFQGIQSSGWGNRVYF